MQEDNTESEDFKKRYNSFVSKLLENKTFFKDAREWYATTYVLPISQRSFFILISIMGLFTSIMIASIVNSVFPLKETVPVIIESKDQAIYKPIIYDLTKINTQNSKTADEFVSSYLLVNYLKEREEHSYRDGNITKYNEKFNKIKNNSSIEVFEEFKKYMSKSNSNSPVHFFGKNISRKVIIKNIKFIRQIKEELSDKIKDFFRPKDMPSLVEIDYLVQTKYSNRTVSERNKAKINFKFNGIQKDQKTNKYLPLKFTVTKYKNYRQN